MHRPDEDVEVYLHRVTRFVWIINSWSVCDTFKFGGGKAFIRRNEARLWEYLKEWMKASGEYEVRFGVVVGMSYFLDEAHLDEYLSLLDGIRHEGYYVRMAVAGHFHSVLSSFRNRPWLFCAIVIWTILLSVRLFRK